MGKAFLIVFIHFFHFDDNRTGNDMIIDLAIVFVLVLFCVRSFRGGLQGAAEVDGPAGPTREAIDPVR